MWTWPSYRSNHTFLKMIDELSTGPEWICELIQIQGDLEGGEVEEGGNGSKGNETEEVELWMCDSVACIRELISNPAFHGEMAYAPEKVYADSNG